MARRKKFDWNEARRLRGMGMTYQAIANQLGVHITRVAVACRTEIRCAECNTLISPTSKRCPVCSESSVGAVIERDEKKKSRVVAQVV
jgi:hypothetical protein